MFSFSLLILSAYDFMDSSDLISTYKYCHLMRVWEPLVHMQLHQARRYCAGAWLNPGMKTILRPPTFLPLRTFLPLLNNGTARVYDLYSKKYFEKYIFLILCSSILRFQKYITLVWIQWVIMKMKIYLTINIWNIKCFIFANMKNYLIISTQ